MNGWLSLSLYYSFVYIIVNKISDWYQFNIDLMQNPVQGCQKSGPQSVKSADK